MRIVLRAIGYFAILIIANVFMANLGAADGWGDKEESAALKKKMLVFLAGLLNGFFLFF